MAKVPSERSLAKKYKDQRLTMLGVNTDPPSDDLLARTRERGIAWRSFADGSTSGPITKDWGVAGFPTTYLIDHEGIVRGIDLEGAALTRAIDKLLAAAETGG